jgi:uncharacterized protein YqgQ
MSAVVSVGASGTGVEMITAELAELQMLREAGLLSEDEYSAAVTNLWTPPSEPIGRDNKSSSASGNVPSSSPPADEITVKPTKSTKKVKSTKSPELIELELLRETGLLSEKEFNDAVEHITKGADDDQTLPNPPSSKKKSSTTEQKSKGSNSNAKYAATGSEKLKTTIQKSEELIQLEELKEQGLLSQEEFDEAVAQLNRKSQSEAPPRATSLATAVKSEELIQLEELKEQGLLSQEEFEDAVAQLNRKSQSEAPSTITATVPSSSQTPGVFVASSRSESYLAQVAEFKSLKEQGLLSEMEFEEAVAALSI